MAKKPPPAKLAKPKPAMERQKPPGSKASSSSADEDVSEIIPAEILETLEEAGINTRNPHEIREAIAISTSMSRSPWPSADMLAEYSEFDPELPGKLINELQGQSAHRRALEAERQTRSEKRQDRAQRNAFIIAVLGILAAGGFSLAGVPTVLTVTIVVSAIGGPNAATVLARLIDKWK